MFLNTVNWIQREKKNDDQITYYKVWKLNPYIYGKIPIILNIQHSSSNKPTYTVLPEFLYHMAHTPEVIQKNNIKAPQIRDWLIGFNKKKYYKSTLRRDQEPPLWDTFIKDPKYHTESKLFCWYTTPALRNLGVYGPICDSHEKLENSYKSKNNKQIYHEIVSSYKGEGGHNAYGTTVCLTTHNRTLFDSIGQRGIPQTNVDMSSYKKNPESQKKHLLKKHAAFSFFTWLSNNIFNFYFKLLLIYIFFLIL